MECVERGVDGLTLINNGSGMCYIYPLRILKKGTFYFDLEK